jgi:hypothetical protein
MLGGVQMPGDGLDIPWTGRSLGAVTIRGDVSALITIEAGTAPSALEAFSGGGRIPLLS